LAINTYKEVAPSGKHQELSSSYSTRAKINQELGSFDLVLQDIQNALLANTFIFSS